MYHRCVQDPGDTGSRVCEGSHGASEGPGRTALLRCRDNHGTSAKLLRRQEGDMADNEKPSCRYWWHQIIQMDQIFLKPRVEMKDELLDRAAKWRLTPCCLRYWGTVMQPLPQVPSHAQNIFRMKNVAHDLSCHKYATSGFNKAVELMAATWSSSTRDDLDTWS